MKRAGAPRRRFGGVPPIVTVLITIAAVVAASLVAWFMWTSTRYATQAPILEVTNAAYLGSGTSWRISFTLRNVGTQSVTVGNSAFLFCDGFSKWATVTSGNFTCAGATIQAGGSVSCTITSTSSLSISPSSVERLTCTLDLGAGVSVGFVALKP